MKKTTHFGTVLLLLMGLFSNTAMGQDTFTWKGPANGNWATAANWTKSGTAGTDTYPGQTAGRQLDVAVISNGGTPIINTGATFAIRRLDIWNTTGPVTGSTLTISPNAILNVGLAENNVRLRGGNIINNGTLNISSSATGYAGFPVYGINFDNPVVLPSSPTEYGISGSGTMTINIGSADFAGAAAIAAIGNSGATTTPTNNANVTYKIVANITSLTLNNASANTIAAVRSLGGNNANKLIISGTGFTVGSVGSPDSKAQLIGLAAGSTITIDTGTTLTFNSATGNTNALIGSFSSSTVATNFTNKGTVNLLGASSRPAIGLSSGASGTATVFNISNEGTFNANLSCVRSGDGVLSITNGGGGSANAGTAVNFSNTGTMTLKNTSATAGTGFSIYMANAGETAPLIFTNSGTLNLEGTVYNYGPKCTINNTGIINSNSELRSFTAINNNVGGSINFARTAATATTRQVVFNGLQTSDLSGAIGSVYTDGTNNYTVVSQKFGSGTTMVANVLSSASIPTSGTLTSSGGGTTPVNYSSVSLSSINGALSSTTTNSGTIKTDTASNLNIISGVTNASTGVISPGGASGKGIADFAKSGTPAILSTLRLQVSGSTTAGVDFDQITNSATDAGFDITGATLEITSLYTPSSSVSIPIVTASGSGTISGPFASVTVLTSGWELDYLSPTAVNLVYSIPTIWTGAAADNNFFNEANWRYSGDNSIPAANTINPGANINLHLQINSAAATITSGVIQFGSGRLTIGSANLTATSLSGGTVTVNEGGYIQLSDVAPLLNNVRINFTSGIGWIRTPNYSSRAISNNNIAQIKVNGSPAVYETNLRLDHYYLNGCVIRANLATTTPLTVYDSTNLSGTFAAITVNTIHSNTAIANSMNNNIESFILKKGFMATFANEIDGTGKSKNYIASEEDLVINALPAMLQNAISFIRVMPWNWVTKKGRTNTDSTPGTGTDLNTTWLYNWANGLSSTVDWEYAPMSWGHTGADDASDISNYAGKYNSTQVMSFNEPDDCGGQSGQYGNLCQTDVAVAYHKNLMKTGMRIVSPGCREEGAKTGQWLKEFYDKATAQDIRIDVIAVHWYDWGSNPTVNTNPPAAQVFARFQAYITAVHTLFDLPIWITEFNANPARSNALNSAFMALALPWLEGLDYVERYNWYTASTSPTIYFYEADGTTLTSVGTTYKNQVSTPQIPALPVNANSNLNLTDNTNVAFNKPVIASSAFSTNVASNAVDGDGISTSSQWQVDVNSQLPAWLEVDLQGSFTVDSFRIFEQTNASKNFRFEVWDATLNSGAGGWSIALTVTNNPATPLTTYKTITPVTTTKVRLVITAHTSTDYLRMFELEVYGVPNNPTWTGTTGTNWATASNWSTGIVPDQYSNVTIAGGTSNQPAISASTAINWLTIDAGAELTVTAPLFTVTEAITNSGAMTLANNANLLQGTTFNNTGNINVIRNSNALSRLDYTIWSSPVTNPNQFLTTFSPETSLNRFYNYNQTTNLYNAVTAPATTPFAVATGYLIRMPNTAVTFPDTQIFKGDFTGVPNNGVITKPFTYSGSSFGYNLIGNPYPSTLDADLFITTNASKIQSSLYFWRKTNAASGSAYAVYNAVGSTKTPTSDVPNGDIQVGQGFFVKAKFQDKPEKYFITFNNSMRLGTPSTQFFKTKKEQKDRLWLNLTNTSGVFSQILIGYIAAATLGVDDFDAPYINDSPIALTSNINNEEYTIQARPPFDPTDVVALNFKTDIAGEYTIALDHLDGTFANGQDVYLLDSKTGVETDLKATSYNFTAVAGVDNARFSLKYQKTLKIDASAFNENSVRVYKNNGTLYVNSGSVAINNIKVFDIQGRLITEQKNVKATTATIKDLKATHQVLMVKITGEDNSVVTKKVVH